MYDIKPIGIAWSIVAFKDDIGCILWKIGVVASSDSPIVGGWLSMQSFWNEEAAIQQLNHWRMRSFDTRTLRSDVEFLKANFTPYPRGHWFMPSIGGLKMPEGTEF